jgi:hypothetical protein
MHDNSLLARNDIPESMKRVGWCDYRWSNHALYINILNHTPKAAYISYALLHYPRLKVPRAANFESNLALHRACLGLCQIEKKRGGSKIGMTVGEAQHITPLIVASTFRRAIRTARPRYQDYRRGSIQMKKCRIAEPHLTGGKAGPQRPQD